MSNIERDLVGEKPADWRREIECSLIEVRRWRCGLLWPAADGPPVRLLEQAWKLEQTSTADCMTVDYPCRRKFLCLMLWRSWGRIGCW